MPPKMRQKAPKGRADKPEKNIGTRITKDYSHSFTANKNMFCPADPRFANIETDPRFRLPSKKHGQVKLDKRFSRVLKDEEFSKKANVDRYGRKVGKAAGRKELEKLYRLEDEDDSAASKSGSGSDEEADDDDEVQKELARLDKKYDPARDGGFSSSSDDDSSEEEEEEVEDEEEEAELAGEADIPMGDISSRIALVNLDWDNIRAVDLMAVANSFVPVGGRISNVTVYPSEFGRERLAKEEVEGPPKEIFASNGDNEDDEDDEPEDESDSDSEAEREKYKKELVKENKGEEFDSSALRSYQLDRLRYYYAVITCSTPETTKALYDSMDGREYLSTANFFDMRFVPDDVSFDDDKPRDSCSKIPDGYRPNEFTTDALTHSKVKLTWDADDATRKEVQKRAFSRAEIDENDLQAYLGSDASSDEEENEDRAAKLRAALGLSAGAGSSKSKKNRDAGPVGDMQVTFTPGLSAKNSGKKASVFANAEPEREETTIEKYVRKEKERKALRKERTLAVREGRDPDAKEAEDDDEEETGSLTSGSEDDEDEFASFGEDEEEEEQAPKLKSKPSKKLSKQRDDETEEADPFNDPFFQDPTAHNKALKKASKEAKLEEARLEKERNASKRAELELLMLDDDDNDAATTREGGKPRPRNINHFDMAAILKAEKEKARKGKKGRKPSNKKGDEADKKVDLQQDFKLDVQDPRFARLYDSHEFAIDPTNPRFKSTEGMKALLEEGRRRRKEQGVKRGRDGGADEEVVREKRKKRDDDGAAGGEDLKRLMERVKGRSKR